MLTTKKLNEQMHRSSSKGFTLLEILLVLTLMAVLSAILFAVVGRAKESGRRSTCQSNLRQIGLALQQYVQDYDGIYPQDRSDSRWYEAAEPYLKSSQLLGCPSQNYPLIYNFNRERLNSSRSPIPLAKDAVGKHEAALTHLSHVIILEDALTATNAISPYRIVEVPPTCPVAVTTGAYSSSTVHSDGGNYAFADGHVKWLSPEERVEAECVAGPYLLP